MLVLGIETSCDETAAAIVRDGREILSSVIASQIATHKRFGGVVATDDVTLDVVRGEVHALIGPNGAGKTTLIGQISGVLATETGRIVFNDVDITRLSAHAKATSIRSVLKILRLSIRPWR